MRDETFFCFTQEEFRQTGGYPWSASCRSTRLREREAGRATAECLRGCLIQVHISVEELMKPSKGSGTSLIPCSVAF